MDRLTVDTNLGFCDIAQCSSTPGGSFCEDGYCDQRRCYERLREYERIGTVDQFREALRRTAEHDKAMEEGRLVILPPSAREGDPRPDCFEEYSDGLWCLGYQRSATDDEPCDRCKQCWYCDDGDYADDRQEAEAALSERGGDNT